jgi:hypothetical protein
MGTEDSTRSVAMTPAICWQEYVGDVPPDEFVRHFDTRDPRACAEQFVAEQGVVFGIVRRGLWRDTFAQETQLTREAVATMIAAHLEETREVWEAVPIAAPLARQWEEEAPLAEEALEHDGDGDYEARGEEE